MFGETAFPGLLNGMLYELDMQDAQKKWLLSLPKGKTVLQGSCLMKESARHSAGHRRKWLTNCQKRLNSLSDFLLHEKVCQILWACRLEMDVPTLQKNFGRLFRQQDVSVNSRVLKVAYKALSVNLGNIIFFWGLWWIEDKKL